MAKILAINPGSTSTKIAIYEDELCLFKESVEHDPAELAKYETIYDQFTLRGQILAGFLQEKGFSPADLTALVARGGLLPHASPGAYLVTPELLDTLRHRAQGMHISNIGAALANSLGEPHGLPSYIYDPVTADQMDEVVRITGLKEIQRRSQGHILNMRSVAIKFAQENNCAYNDLTCIVAHLGGGITLSLHCRGRIIDMISDDEGPFSPERAGGLPGFQLAKMVIEGNYDMPSLLKLLNRQGGFMSHFGTTDARVVSQLVREGDAQAKLVMEALALNVAKNIAKLAPTVNGQIDHIILTGGLANSKTLTGLIAPKVTFIAPVTILPGENEMEALAFGCLRVLRGEESAKEYHYPG